MGRRHVEGTPNPTLRRGLFKPRKVEPGEKASTARQCPQCGAPMREFNYAYDSNVFLDRCPKCDGIWADSGEIRRIAQHLKIDPEVDAIGRGLIAPGAEEAVQQDIEKVTMVLRVLCVLARLFVFKC